MRCCSSPRRDAACWGMMGRPLEKPAEAASQLGSMCTSSKLTRATWDSANCSLHQKHTCKCSVAAPPGAEPYAELNHKSARVPHLAGRPRTQIIYTITRPALLDPNNESHNKETAKKWKKSIPRPSGHALLHPHLALTMAPKSCMHTLHASSRTWQDVQGHEAPGPLLNPPTPPKENKSPPKK